MSSHTFRVGTRGSRLALRQTELVLEALRSARPSTRFQIKPIRTAGDKDRRGSLSEIGGRGVFVKELEQALLADEIDIAVHSLKDLPTEEASGIRIAAVAARADVRDVLVSRDGHKLADLPMAAVIGSGSPRRAAQLLAFRPDLRVADIRGNVDTRLRKVQEGEIDAVVLAAAGLARLGWLERASELIPLEVILSAVGQGALAVEVRTEDEEAVTLVQAIDHGPTRLATAAERAFLRRLGGGCHAAVAALGQVSEDSLHLRGLVAGATGVRLLRGEIEGLASEAESLGTQLAQQLIAQGAEALLKAAT